jgi:protein SCO1/2
MNDQFLMQRMTVLKRYLVLALSIATTTVQAQVVLEKPQALQGIDVVERLGEMIPETLTFQDETGKTVKLGDYLHQGKPLILVMAYYRCPMLCNLVLNGVCESAKGLDLSLGKDYNILTVSIDSRETWEMAAAKKTRYKEAFGKSEVEQGWVFLADPSGNAKVLAEAIGFKYFYDKKRDEYAHPAVIVLLSPEGKITRYIYGISYKQFDLKLSLIEASQGKVGTTIDRLILSCFHYDPKAGSYVPMAMNIMRLGGVITLVVLTAILGSLWMRESRKHKYKGNSSVDIPTN